MGYGTFYLGEFWHVTVRSDMAWSLYKKTMTKILDFRKQVSEDNFNKWHKESFNELMCDMLAEYKQIRNAILSSDYDKVIAKCEGLTEAIERWLVPIRNKAQEARNRKYRMKKTKVVKLWNSSKHV